LRVPKRLLEALDSSRGGPLWEGLAAACLLLALYVPWIWAYGDPPQIWSDAGPPAPHPENRLNLTIILLLAFLWATARHRVRRDPRDLAAVRRLTGLGEGQFREILAGLTAFVPGRVTAQMLGFALVGIAIVPATQSEPLFFLEPAIWDAQLAWSFAANALLFGSLGLGLYSAVLSRRVTERVAAAIEHIDLLDPSELAPFSRMALRHAFMWAGGSSIASLLFLDVEVLWPVLATIVGTLYLATRAFLEPVRAVHLRLREARHAELARVRERIAKARAASLERGEPGTAAELTGLLAWEARIDGVSEWPFDVSTLLRFGALIALALGSWLGGALVERLLGSVLD
jgi:hypothetical protein